MLYVHLKAGYDNLLVDARNPTRYDLIFAPVYITPGQMQEVVSALRNKRVPYMIWSPVKAPADTVTRCIREQYEQPSQPQPLAASLWKLKRPENNQP